MLGVLVKQVQGIVNIMVQNILAPAKFDETEFL